MDAMADPTKAARTLSSVALWMIHAVARLNTVLKISASRYRLSHSLILFFRANFKTPPFARSLRQDQILILEIFLYIPAVKIFVFLDLEQN
jgi:hypothetical protein